MGLCYDDDYKLVERELRQENEQLKARVAELEGALVEASNNGAEADNGAWFYGFNSERLDGLLNRTSHQSLASIKAQTLREFAEKRYDPLCTEECISPASAYSHLCYEADRIEKGLK